MLTERFYDAVRSILAAGGYEHIENANGVIRLMLRDREELLEQIKRAAEKELEEVKS
jgi:hypothetical protein